MFVKPLFVADLETLKSRLRLSGVTVTSDADSIIQKAVEDVRIGFFNAERGLGEARVLTLLAVPFVLNALTSAELQRTKVNNLEVSWTRMLLLRRMPMLFMDASSVTHETWNEEPLTRSSSREIENEISRLQEEISNGLRDLTGDPGVGVDIFVIEPAIPPEQPGSSIKPILLRGT